MFAPTRNEARQFLIEAWRKRREALPLTPLETIAADLVALHPEYHALLESGDKALDREWRPEQGETNPFLHLSMHLSIHEQVSIDQPRGVRDLHERLTRQLASRHDAEHEMMDCLSQMIWTAQRHGLPPDPKLYLDCLGRKAGRQPGMRDD
jgi:hypothetical protein